MSAICVADSATTGSETNDEAVTGDEARLWAMTNADLHGIARALGVGQMTKRRSPKRDLIATILAVEGWQRCAANFGKTAPHWRGTA